MSIAAVALAHSLNANMLRKWVIDAEHEASKPVVAPALAPVDEVPLPPSFVPLALQVPPVDGDIRLAELLAAMIRVDAVWLCTTPMDMRAGTDTALARVVQVFGAARPHHAYVFANNRLTRLKVLVHDGIGIWLAARRLPRAASSGREAAAAHRSRSRASSWMRSCSDCPGSV